MAERIQGASITFSTNGSQVSIRLRQCRLGIFAKFQVHQRVQVKLAMILIHDMLPSRLRFVAHLLQIQLVRSEPGRVVS